MSIYFWIALMAITTYLIRMIPLTLFRKQITNKRVKSFMYFVPYACLTSMTVPAIFFSTGGVVSAVIGLIVALIAALSGRSLPTVAALACVAVFIAELFL